MPDVTLDHLTLDELRKLQKAVTAAIRRTEKRRKRRRAARAAIAATAYEYGFPLSELLDGKAERRAPKYVHPENSAQTWSGRGRRPRWVTAALAAGWTLEDLLR